MEGEVKALSEFIFWNVVMAWAIHVVWFVYTLIATFGPTINWTVLGAGLASIIVVPAGAVHGVVLLLRLM